MGKAAGETESQAFVFQTKVPVNNEASSIQR
jgi:hypothetical protein